MDFLKPSECLRGLTRVEFRSDSNSSPDQEQSVSQSIIRPSSSIVQIPAHVNHSTARVLVESCDLWRE